MKFATSSLLLLLGHPSAAAFAPPRPAFTTSSAAPHLWTMTASATKGRSVTQTLMTASADATTKEKVTTEATSTFFADPRDIVEKTNEVFTKYRSSLDGFLTFEEGRALMSDVLGEKNLSMDDYMKAFTLVDRDLTNANGKLDLCACVAWVKFLELPEVQDTIATSGAAAGLLKSVELYNARFLALLQDSARNMSPTAGVTCPKYPKAVKDGLDDAGAVENDPDPAFDSVYSPLQMRCLALVSHNNMKGTMKAFVEANKNLLKKFRLTGTNSTMTMLREVFGDDPYVVYGPSCKSGPLGGDAELVGAMCNGDLGGMFFFQDPMDSHMHNVDIACLNRQTLIYNVMTAGNPTSALMMTQALRMALKEGKAEMMPSFFFTLECPTVEMYAQQQKSVIQANIDAGN